LIESLVKLGYDLYLILPHVLLERADTAREWAGIEGLDPRKILPFSVQEGEIHLIRHLRGSIHIRLEGEREEKDGQHASDTPSLPPTLSTSSLLEAIQTFIPLIVVVQTADQLRNTSHGQQSGKVRYFTSVEELIGELQG